MSAERLNPVAQLRVRFQPWCAAQAKADSSSHLRRAAPSREAVIAGVAALSSCSSGNRFLALPFDGCRQYLRRSVQWSSKR